MDNQNTTKLKKIPLASARRPSASEVGFTLNDKGQLTGFNGNQFARYLLTRFTLQYTLEGRFYLFADGYFQFVEEFRLKRWFREVVHEFVPDCWTATMESTYLAALRREALAERPMDGDRNLLNLENGMLNLTTLKLVPHDPRYQSTIRIPIDYAPMAKCPKFKKFLMEIFDDDASRVRVVQQMLGYCLTSEVKAQTAFILYGSGSNGKSVLAEIMRELCGPDNVSAVSLGELSNSFARLDLIGKNLNLITEAELDGAPFRTDYFKAIVGGDLIRAEIKNGASFNFKPFAKLVTCTNNLPYSRDRSFGLSRRLLIIPFDRQFHAQEIDPDLTDKLKTELPGILQFAIRGLQRLRKHRYHFSKSAAIENAKTEYQKLINPMILFIDEMLEAGSAMDRVYNHQLITVFKSWCNENGHGKMTDISHERFHAQLKMALRDKRIPFTVAEGGKRYLGGVRFKVHDGCEETDLDEI